MGNGYDNPCQSGDVDTIYHYTSPEGILSILTHKTLWFTDCEYLNDKKEGKQLGGDDGFRHFVLSTSLNDDTTAMWNYYCKNSVYLGYNLGIRVRCLKTALQKDTDSLNSVAQAVSNSNIEGSGINVTFGKIKYAGRDNRSKSGIDALLCKSEPAKCEEEYRVILSFPQRILNNYCSVDKNSEKDKSPNLKLKYRVGTSGIITPYIEWSFTLEEKSELFSQITLAPMIEAELAKKSFERFLDESVRINISIKESSMKLRF